MSARLRWGVAALALGLAALGLLLGALERAPAAAALLLKTMPAMALLWAFGGDWLVEQRGRGWPLALIAAVIAWGLERLINDPGDGLLGVLRALLVGVLVAGVLLVVRHPQAPLRAGALRREGIARPWRLLLGCWALAMIPAPLFPDAFVPLAYASTSALTLAVLSYAWRHYGPRSLLLFAVAFTFGIAIEVLGERTGVPFGEYQYLAPGPALFGVPLLVPLGWFAFTLIAIAVAPVGAIGVRLGAPLALVAWDVGLDPLMVREGFWVFAHGPYFGVPWSNFIGWYLAGMLLVALLLRLEPRLAVERSADLRAVYLAQAFLMGVGLSFYGLPLAGVIAGLAMLAVFALGARGRPLG